MKLTEKQRWDVIRAMVKQKNDEYSAFLLRFFDQKQMSQIVGLTRDIFLVKCGFSANNPLVALEERVKSKGGKPASTWLDNLSSEDLLLFLDYRCKVLQQMYKQFKMNRVLEKKDIKNIINGTQVSELIGFNKGKLMHTGKPERSKDEVKVKDLGLSNDELMHEALAETMGKLVFTYASTKKCNINDAKKLAENLVTHNATPEGFIIGHQFEGEINDVEPLVIPKLKMIDERDDQQDTEEISLYGFDKHNMPVFIKNGQLVNLLGNAVDKDDVIYDERHTRFDDYITNEPKARHVGFDGQGRPVYEYDNAYYNSIGEVVEEDHILPNYEDDFAF